MNDQDTHSTEIMMFMVGYGLIIISELSEHPECYILNTPAVVVHERPQGMILGFALTPWLPHELIDGTKISVTKQLIIGRMVPSPQLVSFYNAWAITERDKLKQFNKEFNQQVAEIEKIYTDRYKDALKRKTLYSTSQEHSSNDLLIAHFEEDTAWGNSSITN